jgi:hypothetical protein
MTKYSLLVLNKSLNILMSSNGVTTFLNRLCDSFDEPYWKLYGKTWLSYRFPKPTVAIAHKRTICTTEEKVSGLRHIENILKLSKKNCNT